jgi:hypothetical protein
MFLNELCETSQNVPEKSRNPQADGYERATFAGKVNKTVTSVHDWRRMFAFGCGVSLAIYWSAVALPRTKATLGAQRYRRHRQPLAN